MTVIGEDDPALDELRARLSDLETCVEGLEQMLANQAGINAKMLALLQGQIPQPERPLVQLDSPKLIMPVKHRELN